MFSCGPLFKLLYDDTFPVSKYDLHVLQGGTDSGKTVAAMQFETTIARCSKPPKSDPIITILNKSVPDSKKGAYQTFQNIINDNQYDNQYVLDGIKDWNKTDRIVTWYSGWLMHFEGAIDEQSAKQGKRQRLFCNEVNGLTWPIFWQYLKRTRQHTTVDYNPSSPFFVHDNFLGPGGVALPPSQTEFGLRTRMVISDHRHNPFLSPTEHAKTENIRDYELWKVYARGATGNLIGMVYQDWTPIDPKDFPWDNDKLFVGVDFGYTNDPTALVLIAKVGEKVFVHELLYEPGVSAALIRDILVAKGVSRVYSEHDGHMIKQLRLLGLNVIPAKKGPGSIKAGVAKVKEYKVYYTNTSTNLVEELKRYSWEINPETKKPTNEPVDQFNHLMDAIRYAIYTQFYR